MSGEPKRIMLAIPCHDARVDVATVAGLLQVCAAGGGSVQPFLSAGDSNIAHHRNSIAHALKTRPEYKDCDTLVWVDSDIGFTVQDFLYVMEPNADGTHPDLVIAPYSEKNESGRSIEWGMGFVRTSRELFEKLDAWMVEEQEALNRYYLNGELATHYFFNGAMPNMRWHGEDSGFFYWCSLHGGIKMRRETRTRLTHWGRKGYTYPPPATAGQDEGAQ